jgi:hypothetical protein
MRRLLLCTAAVILCTAAVISLTAVPAFAEDAPPPAQQNASPPTAQSAPQQSQQLSQPAPEKVAPSGEKSVGEKSGGPALAEPNHQQKADEALQNPVQSGRVEPSATNTAAKEQQPEGPVLVNGAWNVNGAPKDSQTIPAKFSRRNDTIDKKPIIAMRLESLDEAQRKAIAAAIGKANAKVVSIKSGVSQELPAATEMSELPKEAADMPALAGMKYVQLQDRILLVDPANRIVVGEITR